MTHFTVAIIGAGPGGYETAIKLHNHGISTICFEKEKLGGVCLNKGCIPTKALAKIADFYTDMKIASDIGLESASFPVDYLKVQNRKNQVVEKLVNGLEHIFNKNNIPLMKVSITKINKIDEKYVLYTGDLSLCTADYLIIATGSEPKSLPNIHFDNEYVYSSDHILAMNKLPKSLAIIGGGVIGCEFACIYAQLGVDVTIIEFLPDIIATEDEEISKKLLMSIKKHGIKILTKTVVETVNTGNGDVEIVMSNGKTLTTEKLLISVGRKPVFNIETHNFEILRSNGFIKTDEFYRTSEEKIFAIGDVNGKLMLAHVATHQGLLVADLINSQVKNTTMRLKPINYDNIPACIYTNPEVASCGLTEKQAKDKYNFIKIGKLPYSANGKAVAVNATNGFVKIIINNETNMIIGVHIIGYAATELIAQASILIGMQAEVNHIENIIFAHPTISEIIAVATR